MSDSTRIDMIKKMTDSLSGREPYTYQDVGAGGVGIGNQLNNNNNSIASGVTNGSFDSSTSLLYKYGQEVGTSMILGKSLPNSIPSLGRKQLSRSSFSDVRESIGLVSAPELVDPSFCSDESVMTSHLHFLVNLEKNKNSKTPKLVSGSQFRLTTKEFHRCDQCEILEKVNKKSKEVVRSLKLQISRLEEKYHELKLNKTTETLLSTVKAAVDNDGFELSDHDKAIKKNEQYEDEIARMKKLIGLEKVAHDAVKKSMEEIRSNFKLELIEIRSHHAKCEDDLKRMTTKKQELDLVNSNLLNDLQILQQNLTESDAKIIELNKCLQAVNNSTVDIDYINQIDVLKSELTNSETSLKNLKTALREKNKVLIDTEDRADSAGKKIQELQLDNHHLETSLRKIEAEFKLCSDQLATHKKRCDVLEGTLKATIVERETAIIQFEKVSNDLEQSVKQNRAADSEIHSLNKKQNDLLQRMTQDSETMKRALEKSITASIRLCVVAPTVNVHVADKKLKFKAGMSENALKNFLHAEVLDRYSFLYKQKTENSSPDGSNMELWLQKMLAQMQVSIEHHVNSAMDGSSI